MIRYAQILLAVLLLTTGSAFAQKTPIEFNDKIAGITTSLYNKGVAWGAKFQELYKGSKNFSQLRPLTEDLQSYVKQQMMEVKNMKAVGTGAEDLRQAMLEFLRIENNMIQDGFWPMDNLTPKSSDASIKKAVDGLVAAANTEAPALAALQKAQRTYARKNNFRIADDDENSGYKK